MIPLKSNEILRDIYGYSRCQVSKANNFYMICILGRLTVIISWLKTFLTLVCTEIIHALYISLISYKITIILVKDISNIVK